MYMTFFVGLIQLVILPEMLVEGFALRLYNSDHKFPAVRAPSPIWGMYILGSVKFVVDFQPGFFRMQ